MRFPYGDLTDNPWGDSTWFEHCDFKKANKQIDKDITKIIRELFDGLRIDIVVDRNGKELKKPDFTIASHSDFLDLWVEVPFSSLFGYHTFETMRDAIYDGAISAEELNGFASKIDSIARKIRRIAKTKPREQVMADEPKFVTCEVKTA